MHSHWQQKIFFRLPLYAIYQIYKHKKDNMVNMNNNITTSLHKRKATSLFLTLKKAMEYFRRCKHRHLDTELWHIKYRYCPEIKRYSGIQRLIDYSFTRLPKNWQWTSAVILTDKFVAKHARSNTSIET